jgi:transposase InsO family protein
VLREWRQRRSTATAYIEPGMPWQNAYVESFNSRLRDELLNTECLAAGQIFWLPGFANSRHLDDLDLKRCANLETIDLS